MSRLSYKRAASCCVLGKKIAVVCVDSAQMELINSSREIIQCEQSKKRHHPKRKDIKHKDTRYMMLNLLISHH